MARWSARKSRGVDPADDQIVLRHKPRERTLTEADITDPSVREKLEAHLERHLGEMSSVWHELVSDKVHLDVYMWRPTAEDPMFTFVTGGMSDLPMTVPTSQVEAGVSDRAELMIRLPATWPVPADEHSMSPWEDPSAYMPILWLKRLARLPHDADTWLAFGHSIPTADPPKPLSVETDLCGWLLLPPITTDPGIRELEIDGFGRIDIFGLVALHPDEMDHKLTHGTDSLFDGFDRAGVSELLDVNRPSSVPLQ